MHVMRTFGNELEQTTDAPPAPAAGFRWVRRECGWILECERLATLHGWTTRARAGPTAGEGCEAGWRQLAELGAVTPDRVVRLRQVHSARVLEARGPLNGGDEADGVVTRDPDVLLTVRVADCVPILIADTNTGAVGAVHAGWRGTADGIAGRTVERLTELFGTNPSDLVAAIGPAIGPCCYQVRPDVRDAFRASGWPDQMLAPWFDDGARRLNLWRANRDQLVAAGVLEEAAVVASLCTACHPRWFCSYRRDGDRAGRMHGFIRMAAGPGGSGHARAAAL